MHALSIAIIRTTPEYPSVAIVATMNADIALSNLSIMEASSNFHF
jgi:hypothetical protein